MSSWSEDHEPLNSGDYSEYGITRSNKNSKNQEKLSQEIDKKNSTNSKLGIKNENPEGLDKNHSKRSRESSKQT